MTRDRIEKAFRSVWQWRWLFVMNVYLLSPVLLYEFRIGEGGPDKTSCAMCWSCPPIK